MQPDTKTVEQDVIAGLEDALSCNAGEVTGATTLESLGVDSLLATSISHLFHQKFSVLLDGDDLAALWLNGVIPVAGGLDHPGETVYRRVVKDAEGKPIDPQPELGQAPTVADLGKV